MSANKNLVELKLKITRKLSAEVRRPISGASDLLVRLTSLAPGQRPKCRIGPRAVSMFGCFHFEAQLELASKFQDRKLAISPRAVAAAGPSAAATTAATAAAKRSIC